MNKAKLSQYSSADNIYGFELNSDERAILFFLVPIVGDQNGQLIGMDVRVTLTDKRFLMNNGAALWAFDILNDFGTFSKVDYGKFIFKGTYYSLMLLNSCSFDYGKRRLTALRFYFNKKTKTQEDIFFNELTTLFN